MDNHHTVHFLGVLPNSFVWHQDQQWSGPLLLDASDFSLQSRDVDGAGHFSYYHLGACDATLGRIENY